MNMQAAWASIGGGAAPVQDTRPFEPRWYQVDAVRALFDYFQRDTGNPVVAMPTGTGKSATIAMFLQWAFHLYPYTRAVVLTHVKELIEQDSKALDRVWPGAPYGVYSAGLKRRELYDPITFAGIASAKSVAREFGHRDIVIIDEAHLLSPDDATMYQAFIATLREINPHIKVVGFTATPYRMGFGLITDNGIFTDICYDLTTVDGFALLISQGYMVPLFPKHTNLQLDVSGIGVNNAGEFVASQMQKKFDHADLTNAALLEMYQGAHNRHSWLIFASGVEHAENVAAAFGYFGIAATAIHSKLTPAERDYRIAAYKGGDFRVAVNNNILTTGFDHPPLDFIGVLRATNSCSLWVQMLGRGTRPSAETYKSNCLVHDYAGNTARLGPIDDPCLPKRKGETSGDAPVKICDACGFYNHTRAAFCTACGAAFDLSPQSVHKQASEHALLRSAERVTEFFTVDAVLYARHQKKGSPHAVLRVNYRCGMQMFSEWVCLEHPPGNFARSRAEQWWMQRSADPVPQTVDEALRQLTFLRKPRRIYVWTNANYPEVLSVEW